MPFITPISSTLTRRLFVLWALVTGLLAVLCFRFGYTSIYHENGLLENTQVVLLTLALFGFLRTIRSLQGSDRDLGLFLTLLMFAFIMREVDVDSFDVHPILIFLLAEEGRVMYLLPSIALFGKLCLNGNHYLRFIKYYFNTSSFSYIVLAALFYTLLSEIFDKKYVTVAHSFFWEESIELAASMLLCVVGCSTFRRDIINVNLAITQEYGQYKLDSSPSTPE